MSLDYVAQGFDVREARHGGPTPPSTPPAAPRRHRSCRADVRCDPRAVGTSCDTPLCGTHGQFSQPGGRAAHGAGPSSPMSRCGSRRPVPPDIPEEHGAVARGHLDTHMPPASGLTTQIGVSPGVIEFAPPPSCSPISAAPAASSRPRRSRPVAEAHHIQDRTRIVYCRLPSSALPTPGRADAEPNFSHPGNRSTVGRYFMPSS